MGAERVEGRFNTTLTKLTDANSSAWIGALEAAHQPLAESNLAALVKTTTAMGKALWVIKTLGAFLTLSAVCLLVLGLQQPRQVQHSRATKDEKGSSFK